MPKFKRWGKSKADPNRTLTPPKLVRIYLNDVGRSTRGPIEKFVEERTGKSYYDHKGLDEILDKLIDEGLVRKLPKGVGRPYPLYELTPKGVGDVSLEASYFALEATRDIVNYDLEKETVDSILEKTVRKLGVYTIFSCIQGSKRALTENKDENKMEVENAWFDNTVPMKSLYPLLDYAIQVLASNKRDIHYDVFKKADEMKYLDALEKKLVKLFPEETKRYLAILNETRKKKEEYQAFVKHLHEVEKYLRLRDEEDRKLDRKLPKKCPKCHYDLTTPTKERSRVTLVGAVPFTTKSLKKRQPRTCPACGSSLE